jgi:hypothetical protein
VQVGGGVALSVSPRESPLLPGLTGTRVVRPDLHDHFLIRTIPVMIRAVRLATDR